MRQAGFPESEAHRSQHAAFVARVTEMADRLSSGRLLLSIETTSFLRDWLLHHILETDRELARHLIAGGAVR